MTMKAARVWMFVSPIVLGMAIWGIAKWSGGSERVENAVGKNRDVASYANWLNALPEERRTDDLIMKVIAPISSKDPVGALMWVQKVEDPNIRSGLAKEIRGRITSEDTKRDVESMIEKGQLSGEMFE